MDKRLFLAIPLSQELKNIILEKRKIISPDLRWIPEENLHITLHFQGKTEESKIPELIHKISEVTKPFPSFYLSTKEIGTQAGKFQKMVWVKFINAPEFVELSREIAHALDVNLSRKPLPHINLIRFKDLNYFLNNPALPMILNEEIKMKEVELWESELRPGKFPIYKSLHKYRLNENKK